MPNKPNPIGSDSSTVFTSMTQETMVHFATPSCPAPSANVGEKRTWDEAGGGGSERKCERRRKTTGTTQQTAPTPQQRRTAFPALLTSASSESVVTPLFVRRACSFQLLPGTSRRRGPTAALSSVPSLSERCSSARLFSTACVSVRRSVHNNLGRHHVRHATAARARARPRPVLHVRHGHPAQPSWHVRRLHPLSGSFVRLGTPPPERF